MQPSAALSLKLQVTICSGVTATWPPLLLCEVTRLTRLLFNLIKFCKFLRKV